MFIAVLGHPKTYISRNFTVKSAMSTTKFLASLPHGICRKKICLLAMVFGILLMSVCEALGQCPVNDGTSEVITVNLSAKKDTSWSLKSKREGTACISTNPPDANSRCIRFTVTLNPGADILVFDTDKEPQSSFYSINCGPLIKIGESVCVTGLTTVCISFCKPGNEPNTYTITTASVIKASGDLLLRQNCSGTMSVSGATSATWTSIFPGSAGTYNNYLNTTSGTSVTVTPQTGAPTEIRYEVTASGSCVVGRKDTVSVFTVPPMTVAINPATPAICNGASVTLSSVVSGGNPPYIYSWNTSATTTGITTSTPALYTLSVSDNTVGCPAVQQSVNVSAVATPTAPTVPAASVCSGSSTTLSVSTPIGTHEWFTVASGGTAIAIGNSYATPALIANATYYVQTTVNGCTSTRTPVTVTVNPIPAAPTASGTTICAGGTASLLATAPGPSYEWYDAPSGGTLLASTAAYTTPALNASTTYYVQATNGTCAGARTAVTVTVTPLPAAPTIAGATICSGNTATLTAIAPGGSYSWWDAAIGGTSLGPPAITYTTPALAINTTYYVETIVNGCTSATRTATTVTVNPTPAAPAVNPVSICGGETATLNVTSIGDTYRWYNAAIGGDLLTTASSYITPALNANTSYYVSATSAAGCTSSLTTTTVTVTPILSPTFTYASNTFCQTDPTNPSPDYIAPGATGTFSGSAGLVINATTGQINLALSSLGPHIVTLSVTSGSCSYTRSVSIRIVDNTPIANFDYGTGQFCVNQANVLPTFVPGGSAGVFSGSGINFQNVTTGEINLTLTPPGTYQVINTITGAGGCLTVSSTSTITVNPPATANAGVNLITCEGQPITLNGTIGGSANAGTWSIVSGAGTLVSASLLNTSFTPIGLTRVSLMLTTDDPVTPCSAVSDIMFIDIKPKPDAPTVNPVTICAGTTATLIAYGSVGTYNWFDVATGGTALSPPNSTYNSAVLNNSTTYYVTSTSADDCTSDRSAVVVTVNQLPEVNSAPAGAVCSQEEQNYTPTATIPSSSFVWSRAAVPNITNAVITGQTTTTITEALESLSTSSINVFYQIVPTANGCAGAPFIYTVTVKPIPVAPTATTAGAVCVGETISLSTPDRPTASYAWTGPDGFTSVIRQPEILNASVEKNGTYFIRVTVEGCTSPAGTVTQTVKTRPAAPTVSNSSPVCVGEDVTLSTPIVIGASYLWTGPNGYTSSAQNPTILSIAEANAGNYLLALSVNGCVGESSTTSVAVNPIPSTVALSSTGPVCLSESLNITADAVPLAAYTWTGPNGFVSSVRDIMITDMNADKTGTYQVIVSVAGCPSVANTITAALKPTPAAPTINPIAPVCENGTLTLNASSDPTATYTWSGPSGFTSALQNPVVSSFNATKAGSYVAYVVVNGCRSANSTVNVTMQSLPVVSSLSTNGPVCVGNTLQLNTATISGASYQWIGPNGFTSTNQNPSIPNVSLNDAGNYSLALSVNGCVGPASLVAAVINPLPDAVGVSSSGPVCNAETLRITANEVPAGTYAWTGPNGFTSTNREIEIVNMNAAKTGSYQVIVSVAGCPSVANAINATLKPTPNAPTINPVTPVCENGTLILGTSLVSGATYSWSGPLGFSSNTQSPAISSVTLANAGIYSANIVVDGCRSENSTVNVAVLPLPAAPTLSTNGAVCVGNVLQLNTPNVTGASYRWTGPAGFTSTVQNPSISNATVSNAGTYILSLTVNGCTGPSDSVVAVVNPLPGAVNINSSGPACQGRPLRFSADSVVAGVYTWSGPNGFTANTREIFFPTMNNTTAGTYQVAVAVAGCPGAANTINALLKPTPAAPILNAAAPICENGQLNLGMNTVAGAMYQWTGPLAFTSTAQNPRIDSVQLNRSGIYLATVTVDGCISNNSAVNVVVVPEPAKPTITTNSPVCLGSPLQLFANAAANASFRWVKTNTLFGVIQSPVIPSVNLADSGRYGVSVIVNGCASDTVFTNVVVDEPVNVTAGNDQVVCANNATINLAGLVTGGTNTGIWSTSGTGRFGSRISNLSTTYIPSSQDTAAGTVSLTLTATNTGACPVVASSVVVNITDAPTLDIGNNKVICPSDSIIPLNAIVRNAGGAIWTTTGTGRFESGNSLSTNYILSSQDQSSNSFRLRATSTNNGNCLAVTDELVVNLSPAPVVNAGKDLLLYENTPYTLNPTVAGNIRSYEWTPANFLNNSTIKNPVFRGNADQTLTLKVTSTNGCVTTDEVFISVAKPFPIPNVFSPNLDGVHDTWVIPELDKYPEAEVSVFDRTGKRVFYTIGYKTPWDGKYEGKYLPLATYYYIIIPRLIPGVFSGSVTILK